MQRGRKLRLPRGALKTLREADPSLARVIDEVGPCRMRIGEAAGDLDALVRSIIGQQLSGKAAATIYGRFLDLFDSGAFPSADEIRGTHYARLRKVGLSRQKQAAVRDLCRHVCTGALPLDTPDLHALTDEELIERLSAVRGVGRWSGQMFLMFHLGRTDVWPSTDLGIQKGFAKLQGAQALPKPRALEAAGDRYRPFRSIAAWYLWRSLE